MDFSEKLQALRKSRGLPQEELAAALFESRTAISKWESGRGYPSIDSLKEISVIYSVSIDDLLSAEKLILIAEEEHRSGIQNILDFLFGTADLFSLLLIILPLYPNNIAGHIYSVNLFAYTQTTVLNRTVYWTLYLALLLIGISKTVITQLNAPKTGKFLTCCSILLGIAAVFILALTGETYAVAMAFLLLALKSALLFKKR